MIFKTFNSNIDSSISKIGMFNKSFWAMKQDLEHGHSIGFSLFGGQGVDKSDKQAILDFNAALKNGVPEQKAWAMNMSKASIAAQDMTRNTLKAKGSLTDLANGLKVSSAGLISAKLATIGLQVATIALNAALTMGISLLIQGAIQLGTWLWSFVPTAENLAKKFEETTEDLTEINSEIKTLNSELESVQNRINELTSKGTLSITEEAELQRLRLQNSELERQIELQKILQLEASKEQQKTFVNKYKNLDAEQTDEIVGFISDEYIEKHGREKASKKISEYSDMIKGNQEDIQALYDAGYVYGTNKEVDARIDAMNRATDAYMYAMNKVGDTEIDWFSGIITRFPDAKTALEELAKSGEITAEKLKIALNGEYGEELKNLLIYLSTIGAIDLRGILGDDRFGELDTNLDGYIDTTEAAKMGTEDFIKLMPSIVNEFNKMGDAADAAGEDANKMHASLVELEKVSDNIKPLGTAFKELSDDGYITIKTLKEMKDAADLSSDEWAEYESKLLKAKVGSSEFNQVMSDLTYKILDNTFAGKDLNAVTEQQVAAILRENGVVNATAVAHDWLTSAKAKAKLTSFNFATATEAETDALYRELKALGLTEVEVKDLATAYASAQKAMLEAVESGAAGRLGILKSELEGIAGIAEAYALLGKGYDTNGDGTIDYAGTEINRMSPEQKAKYQADRAKIIAYGNAVEALKKIEDIDVTIPNYSGDDKGSSSTENEALDNYLKEAENLYKIHQNEGKYINDLTWAQNNLVKSKEEELDIIGKINEANRKLTENQIKDIEHQIDLKKELYGEDVDVTKELESIKTKASEGANNYRTYARKQLGYDKKTDEEKAIIDEMIENTDEIQGFQKTWWDAQNLIAEWDWNNSNNWIDKRNEKGDWALYGDSEYEAWQRVVKWLREKYPNEIEKIHEATQKVIDARWDNSNNWIEDRNFYNDWALFDDSEVDAWERVVKWLKEEYPDELNKIKEAEQNLFEARKEQLDKANNFANTYIDSQKTLLQSHYNVTNAIAEAQHEINKELETSMTMYGYLDEETRKLLFNQEDYSKLSQELNTIENKALRLQAEYEDKLRNSTLETVESITSEYEMQYETLMKSYEIAKADLEIAKKKQQLNNALNERNVRMFINGQWQWVANTEDVLNAKAELADAEYAKRVEQSGLTQQESINNLTRQQNELGVVVKQFENGVIDLDEAVRLAKDAIGSLPSIVYSMLSNATSSSYSSGSSILGGKGSGYVDWAKSQMARNSANWHTADEDGKRALESANQSLGASIDSDYDPITGTWKHKYAKGTKYTQSGLALMGEEDEEFYIPGNGRLIPITQPTVGNISGGGIVFNAEQMKNLRTMWDMSNLNFGGSNTVVNSVQPQQIDQSQDNRIIINGMTVDSGSADGQALISALRRYVGNH